MSTGSIYFPKKYNLLLVINVRYFILIIFYVSNCSNYSLYLFYSSKSEIFKTI